VTRNCGDITAWSLTGNVMVSPGHGHRNVAIYNKTADRSYQKVKQNKAEKCYPLHQVNI